MFRHQYPSGRLELRCRLRAGTRRRRVRGLRVVRQSMAESIAGRSRPGLLVSFVIIGRNDDYMGDYLYRLGTSLSFLAQSIERTGSLDEVEVLVVDWASDRPLACDVPLAPAARRITTFLRGHA